MTSTARTSPTAAGHQEGGGRPTTAGTAKANAVPVATGTPHPALAPGVAAMTARKTSAGAATPPSAEPMGSGARRGIAQLPVHDLALVRRADDEHRQHPVRRPRPHRQHRRSAGLR
ncbi:hypothetical protein GCM10010428_68240 [Actinosynnema pretiosum subsp. pretiosum]